MKIDTTTVPGCIVRVHDGDTYQVHIGGPDTSATATLHVPSRRLIADWVTQHLAHLGESEASLRDRGYSVTAC